jgi:hypothetical protein
VLAALSWFGLEKRVLKLKNFTPGFLKARSGTGGAHRLRRPDGIRATTMVIPMPAEIRSAVAQPGPSRPASDRPAADRPTADRPTTVQPVAAQRGRADDTMRLLPLSGDDETMRLLPQAAIDDTVRLRRGPVR